MELAEAAVWMDAAKATAARSTCPRLAVGAVLIKEGRVVSSGRNGAAVGEDHCRCDETQPCTISVHAEANCVVFAARVGLTTVNSTMVITHAPCFSCSGLLINAGITEVIYETEYRLQTGLHRLNQAGIKTHQIEREQLDYST